MEARRSRDIQRSLLQAVARSRLVALVAHNWAVAEDKMAVVEERRRCIVVGLAVAVEVRHRRLNRDLPGNTKMRCRRNLDFVDLRGNRRRM